MTLDSSRAPLFIVIASGVLTDEDWAELAEWTQGILAPGRPYAIAFDGTGIRKMTSEQRKMQSDWINRHRATLKKLNRGCGFAIDSAFTRGLLKAVHWLSPPPYPYAVFARREQAIEWCSRQLATEPRFGERFRILRQELAGRQNVLTAEGLRCTDAAISLWEKGRRLPSARMLRTVVEVFVRLGATAEDIEQLQSTWAAERADRRTRPPRADELSHRNESSPPLIESNVTDIRLRSVG